MNSYELMFILRPDLSEEQVTQQRRKYFDLLKDNGAQKVEIKVWGKRRLAYPIGKYQDGIYILANIVSDGSQFVMIERSMRLSEEVIRYLTSKLKTNLEIEDTQFNDPVTFEKQVVVDAPTITAVAEEEVVTPVETETIVTEENKDVVETQI